MKPQAGEFGPLSFGQNHRSTFIAFKCRIMAVAVLKAGACCIIIPEIFQGFCLSFQESKGTTTFHTFFHGNDRPAWRVLSPCHLVWYRCTSKLVHNGKEWNPVVSHWYRHKHHSLGDRRLAPSSKSSPPRGGGLLTPRHSTLSSGSFSTPSPLLSWANSAGWQCDHQIQAITSFRRNAVRENRAGCQSRRVMLFLLYGSTDTIPQQASPFVVQIDAV